MNKNTIDQNSIIASSTKASTITLGKNGYGQEGTHSRRANGA